MKAQKWRPYKARQLIFKSIYAKRREMSHLVSNKAFLKPSPGVDMLFAPSGFTHPPTSVPPFLLTQNLSPKEMSGSDVMKHKVSQQYIYKVVGQERVKLYT